MQKKTAHAIGPKPSQIHGGPSATLSCHTLQTADGRFFSSQLSLRNVLNTRRATTALYDCLTYLLLSIDASFQPSGEAC